MECRIQRHLTHRDNDTRDKFFDRCRRYWRLLFIGVVDIGDNSHSRISRWDVGTLKNLVMCLKRMHRF
jgi:hypothetical protein